MPRTARIVIPGWPHAVFQRGHGRGELFRSDADRIAYLEMLYQQSGNVCADILGYCLMSDHVYVVARPRTQPSLGEAIGRAHWLYSQHVARQSGARELPWQGRFFSCPLDEFHLAEVLLYVERSPVRARLSRYPWAYRWSSAPAHSNGADSTGLLDMEAWRKLSTPSQWRTLLVQPEDEAVGARLRLCLSTGRPLATEATLTRLERRLGRRLRALPVGRPRKQAASKTHR